MGYWQPWWRCPEWVGITWRRLQFWHHLMNCMRWGWSCCILWLIIITIVCCWWVSLAWVMMRCLVWPLKSSAWLLRLRQRSWMARCWRFSVPFRHTWGLLVVVVSSHVFENTMRWGCLLCTPCWSHVYDMPIFQGQVASSNLHKKRSTVSYSVEIVVLW